MLAHLFAFFESWRQFCRAVPAPTEDLQQRIIDAHDRETLEMVGIALVGIQLVRLRREVESQCTEGSGDRRRAAAVHSEHCEPRPDRHHGHAVGHGCVSSR